MSNDRGELVEHFFRHEWANLVSVLTRAFGMRRIDLIEDMVQAALLEAMQVWKQHGIPDHPAGWIHRVAKNRILDVLRREKVHEKAISSTEYPALEQESQIDEWLDEAQLPDSLLRMIFVCCHPSLDRKTQIALTLKTLCGFGVSEIARGLLLSEETVKKRIQRARQSLAEANVSLELPGVRERAQRLDVVHDVLYLMFNEGYSTSQGIEPLREDICEEAVRLCHLLCESHCAVPTTKALFALMLFHAARFEARVDTEGATVLLEDQDRTLWDRCLIGQAQYWLAQSKTEQPSPFHLEAAIAMQHCISPSVAETDWTMIVQLYTRLSQLQDSPVYTFNRAIALAQAGNLEQALSELESLRDCPEFQNYPLLDCAFSRVYEQAGKTQAALDACLRALSRTKVPHEKELLQQRLRKLAGNL